MIYDVHEFSIDAIWTGRRQIIKGGINKREHTHTHTHPQKKKKRKERKKERKKREKQWRE